MMTGMKNVAFTMENKVMNEEKCVEYVEKQTGVKRARNADAEDMNDTLAKRAARMGTQSACYGAMYVNLASLEFLEQSMTKRYSGDNKWKNKEHIKTVQKMIKESHAFVQKMMPLCNVEFPMVVEGATMGLRDRNAMKIQELCPVKKADDGEEEKDEEENKFEVKLCTNKQEVLEAVTVKRQRERFEEQVDRDHLQARMMKR